MVEELLGIKFLKDGPYFNGSFLAKDICVIVKVFIGIKWGKCKFVGKFAFPKSNGLVRCLWCFSM